MNHRQKALARERQDDLESDIREWMIENVESFRDPITDEVGCTEMVEVWDFECASGDDTLDSDHPAWYIAVEVASEFE